MGAGLSMIAKATDNSKPQETIDGLMDDMWRRNESKVSWSSNI